MLTRCGCQWCLLILTVAYKLTFTPQVSLNDRFMSRPVIRAFFTYAKWGEDFVGEVGGNDYQTLDDGFTYGIQVEAWW
jgi:maltoporin